MFEGGTPKYPRICFWFKEKLIRDLFQIEKKSKNKNKNKNKKRERERTKLGFCRVNKNYDNTGVVYFDQQEHGRKWLKNAFK